MSALLPAIDLNADNPPIRTDIPITLHPTALLGTKELNQAGTFGVAALKAARTALTVCHDAYAAIEDVQAALVAATKPVTRSPTAKPEGMVVRHGSDYSDPLAMEVGPDGKFKMRISNEAFIKAADEAFKKVAPQVDAKVLELNGLHKMLSEKVATAIDDPNGRTPAGIALGQELRGYVKGLSEKQRASFMRSAVEAGDKSTVHAVLSAQPFLSGLSIEQHQQVREHAASKFAPVEYAQANATAKLIDQVQTAGSTLLGRYAKVTKLRETPEAVVNKKLAALKALK